MEKNHNDLYREVLKLLVNVQWQTTNTPEDCAAWSDFLEEYLKLLDAVASCIQVDSEK